MGQARRSLPFSLVGGNNSMKIIKLLGLFCVLSTAASLSILHQKETVGGPGPSLLSGHDDDGDFMFLTEEERQLQSNYVEPSYWQRYRDEFGKKVKRCKFRANEIPPNGSPCPRMRTGDYVCLFGEQTCDNAITHPTTTCDCIDPDRKFSCEAYNPCSDTQVEQCPPQHPAFSQAPLTCSNEGLSCTYGTAHCCGVSFPFSTCTCAEGKFTCRNDESCRFKTCDEILGNAPTSPPVLAPTAEPAPSDSSSAPVPEVPTPKPTEKDDISVCPDQTKALQFPKCQVELSCAYGTETCCGETFDSLVCSCAAGGTMACLNTDACFRPSCEVNVPSDAPSGSPTMKPSFVKSAAPSSPPSSASVSPAPVLAPVVVPTAPVPSGPPVTPHPTFANAVNLTTTVQFTTDQDGNETLSTLIAELKGIGLTIADSALKPEADGRITAIVNITTLTQNPGAVQDQIRDILAKIKKDQTIPPGFDFSTSVTIRTNQDAAAALATLKEGLLQLGFNITEETITVDTEESVVMVNVTKRLMSQDEIPPLTQGIQSILAGLQNAPTPSPAPTLEPLTNLTQTVSIRVNSDQAPQQLASLSSALQALGLTIVSETVTPESGGTNLVTVVVNTLTANPEAVQAQIQSTVQDLLDSSNPGTNLTTTVQVNTFGDGQATLEEVTTKLEAAGLTVFNSNITVVDAQNTVVSVDVTALTQDVNVTLAQIQGVLDSLTTNVRTGFNFTTVVTVTGSKGGGPGVIAQLTPQLEALGLTIDGFSVAPGDENDVVTLNVTKFVADQTAADELTSQIQQIIDNFATSVGVNFQTTITFKTQEDPQPTLQNLRLALQTLGLAIDSSNLGTEPGNINVITLQVSKTVADQEEADVLVVQIQEVINNAGGAP